MFWYLLNWLREKLIGENPRNTGKVTSDNILKTLNDLLLSEKHKGNAYLQGRFKDQVWYFETLEDDNDARYSFLKNALFILSGLTTLVIGLEAVLLSTFPLWVNTFLRVIALVFALGTTILSSMLNTFNIQQKSIVYRRYREILITEFYRFHQQLQPYQDSSGVDHVKMFVTNVEQIIEEANRAIEGLQRGSQVAASQKSDL